VGRGDEGHDAGGARGPGGAARALAQTGRSPEAMGRPQAQSGRSPGRKAHAGHPLVMGSMMRIAGSVLRWYAAATCWPWGVLSYAWGVGRRGGGAGGEEQGVCGEQRTTGPASLGGAPHGAPRTCQKTNVPVSMSCTSASLQVSRFSLVQIGGGRPGRGWAGTSAGCTRRNTRRPRPQLRRAATRPHHPDPPLGLKARAAAHRWDANSERFWMLTSSQRPCCSAAGAGTETQGRPEV
jgi:hypothetical protein